MIWCQKFTGNNMSVSEETFNSVIEEVEAETGEEVAANLAELFIRALATYGITSFEYGEESTGLKVTVNLGDILEDNTVH